jgi:hypothetical protein
MFAFTSDPEDIVGRGRSDVLTYIFSFLLRFNPVQTSRVIVSSGIGPSIVASETRASPQGTASTVNTDRVVQQQRFGITAGTDIRLRLRRGLDVFVPLRIASTPRNRDQASFGLPGIQVTIGGGALTDVGRRVR